MKRFAPWLVVLALLVSAPPSFSQVVVAEHVTGGVLDLTWLPGFGLPEDMTALTLDSSHPGYANPSGDHTVGSLTNTQPLEGGLGLTCTDPQGFADYVWEADIFTGDGNTRRGIVVRANADSAFRYCYQFVIQAGLLQLNFRKLSNQTPTTLGTWFTNTLPGGQPAVNTWHHMKVIAIGTTFRCYWDGTQLTNGGPIVDGDYATGWVGAYNFSASNGGVPVLYDDLTLTRIDPTPAATTTWGRVKALYRGAPAAASASRSAPARAGE